MSNLPDITNLNEVNNQQPTVANDSTTSTTSVRVRTPKRILHFSDGTMEEYSDDDNGEDVIDQSPNKNDKQIEVKRLSWGPWMLHRALHAGNRVVAACDYVGEAIAAFLGITTPKYKYEIEQFKKMQEEQAKALKEEKDAGGWMENVNKPMNAQAKGDCITSQNHVQRY